MDGQGLLLTDTAESGSCSAAVLRGLRERAMWCMECHMPSGDGNRGPALCWGPPSTALFATGLALGARVHCMQMDGRHIAPHVIGEGRRVREAVEHEPWACRWGVEVGVARQGDNADDISGTQQQPHTTSFVKVGP